MINLKLVKSDLNSAIKRLGKTLIHRITRNDFNTKSRIPYKLVTVKEIYKQRLLDTLETLKLLIDNERYLSALIMIRSLMELTSVIYGLDSYLEKSLNDKDIDSLDKELMILLVGFKNEINKNTGDRKEENLENDQFKSKNILGYIDKVSKVYENYRDVYEGLSEFVHPNFCGCTNTYSENDETTSSTQFGFNPSKDIDFYVKSIDAANLTVSIFIDKILNIESKINRLVELCNEIINNSGSNKH